MEQNRFFKFIWRANGVFLFVAGLFLVGMALLSAIFLISDFGKSDTPPPPVSATAEPILAEGTFRLKAASGKYNYDKVEGFAYFELRAGNDSWSKFGSGSSSQLRNIAVFDLNSDTTHWIFPDAGQEIEGYRAVNKTETSSDGETISITTGFLLPVAKSLPDGSVSRDLWVMTPDGKTLKNILSGISRSPDIETYGDNQTKLVFESKTHIDIYPFDVDNLTVGKSVRVSVP